MKNKVKKVITKSLPKRRYYTFLDECLGIVAREPSKSKREKKRHGSIST